MQQNHPFLKMKNSPFKLQIMDGEGKQRWVEANKVFTYLAGVYAKTISNSKKYKTPDEDIASPEEIKEILRKK